MTDGRIPGLELKHIPPECLPIWGQKWAKPYRPLGPSLAREHAFWITGSAEELPILIEPASPTLTSDTDGSDQTSSYFTSPYQEANTTPQSTSHDTTPQELYISTPPIHDSTPQEPLTHILFPSPQLPAPLHGPSDQMYLDAFSSMEQIASNSMTSSAATSQFMNVHHAAMNRDSAFVAHPSAPNNNLTVPAFSYDLAPSAPFPYDVQPTAAGHQRCRSTGALEFEAPANFPSSPLTELSNDLRGTRRLSEPRTMGEIRGFDVFEPHAVYPVPDHTFTIDPNSIKPIYSQPDPTAGTSPSQPQRALHIPEFLNPRLALRAVRAYQHGSRSSLAAHELSSASAVGPYDLGDSPYPSSAHSTNDFGHSHLAPIHLDTHGRRSFPDDWLHCADSSPFHGNDQAYK